MALNNLRRRWYLCVLLEMGNLLNKYKRRAVAEQTARCHSKVGLLSIQYVYYFMAYKRQWKGRQNHSLKSQETISQASRQNAGYSV